jgi:hypothetical protein
MTTTRRATPANAFTRSASSSRKRYHIKNHFGIKPLQVIEMSIKTPEVAVNVTHNFWQRRLSHSPVKNCYLVALAVRCELSHDVRSNEFCATKNQDAHDANRK